MKGTPAIYLGRIVEKKHFRAFVYGTRGEKKLVNSWDEFESAMQSGIWFARLEDVPSVKAIADEQKIEKAKPKSRPRPNSKAKADTVEEVDEPSNMLPDDGSVFEVTNDLI